mmetsp:Transcript_30642/g.63449  ORF Transcript_30642/g.63449 Transcript_30642/m.63449 type:complete len:766 (-) Transcript_30642:199-2496(-)
MTESRSIPMLHFDDGSRIMIEGASSPSSDPSAPYPNINDANSNGRGKVPLELYYEIGRVAEEVVGKLDWTIAASRGRLLRRVTSSIKGDSKCEEHDVMNKSSEADDGFLCRIALQFPDELLVDASEVCWLMEEAISGVYKNKLMSQLDVFAEDEVEIPLKQELKDEIKKHVSQPPLVFILGDTTYGSCCPDDVAAQHLNANVLVHYGYACLSSPTENIPVVYCFGVSRLAIGIGGKYNSSGRVVIDENIWEDCVEKVLENIDEQHVELNEGKKATKDMKVEDEELNESRKRKILLLYEVKYHHVMENLKVKLERTGKVSVVLGTIPKQQLNIKGLKQSRRGCTTSDGGCEGGSCSAGASNPPTDDCCKSVGLPANEEVEKSGKQTCVISGGSVCIAETKLDARENGVAPHSNDASREGRQQFYVPRTIGGLEIPNDLNLSKCTLLYIGDDLDIDSNNTNAHTRLLHILLRCNSSDGMQSLWSYSPLHKRFIADILNTTLSPTNSTAVSTALSRVLRRRYFLIQKAKLSTTIAILIGTTSNSYSFRRLLSRTRNRIQSTGRTVYTFAVGKLASSSSKLANFAEIDTFVIIACGETIAKFWKMEREEMLVPVITPMELDVALGIRDWDGRYSCDFGDLIRWDAEDGIEDEYVDSNGKTTSSSINEIGRIEVERNVDDSGSSDDEPFFSMISGKYEQAKSSLNTKQSDVDSDLQALPGRGQLTEYCSEAAEFLKNREYRGLEANVGQTEVKAAILGKVGIASDYGENR